MYPIPYMKRFLVLKTKLIFQSPPSFLAEDALTVATVFTASLHFPLVLILALEVSFVILSLSVLLSSGVAVVEIIVLHVTVTAVGFALFVFVLLLWLARTGRIQQTASTQQSIQTNRAEFSDNNTADERYQVSRMTNNHCAIEKRQVYW